MRPLALAVILALALAPSAFAKGSKCRDAQGHYIKCPPAASAPAGAAAPATAKAPAAPAAKSTSAAPAKSAGYSSHTSSASASNRAAMTAAPAGAPSGATARCKDGTYSMSKSHSGACSHHGGVDSWMK